MKKLYSLLALSLFFCFGIQAQSYPLEVEAHQVHSSTEGLASLDGLTTYRIYVTGLDGNDFVSAVYGNNTSPFELSVPDGIYNSAFNTGWSAAGISPLFVASVPELEYDSYGTIGLTQSASTSGVTGAADPSLVEDPTQQFSPMFLTDGSVGATVNSITGFAYYILNDGTNTAGLPDVDGRVLIMQITTSGTLSGSINVQVFPNSSGADFDLYTYNFDGVGVNAGVGACDDDTDGDGICDEDEIDGCTDMTACNYDETATEDDDTCDYADADSDGVCDADEIDGCTDMTACNYDETATEDDGSCAVDDDCGVCGGDNSTCSGCTIALACNYDATATVDDNDTCEYVTCAGCMDDTACNYDDTATFDPGTICINPVQYYDCDDNCLSDTDMDGTCDELEVDGCTDDTACNYNDLATEEDGSCAVDDECGVCGGTGIPAGDCDCNGNQLDALGVCGGPCTADADGDNICDDVDDCVDLVCEGLDDDCDGVCNADEIDGCTDMGATNYSMDATEEDGSCCYLMISLTATDALCYGGEDGMITATSMGVSDSTATVTYSLGMESNETGEFTVSAGTYTVTATDSGENMCTSSMDVTVGEGAEIIVDASATDETAGALGVGTATATGGAGSYTFVWTDADGTEVDASALAAGDYTVTATDSLGCMGTATVTNIFNSIYDIDPLAFGLFPNPTTGAITLQVSNVMKDVKMQVLDATGRVVFTQDALVLQGATTFNFSDLSTGTYTIMISNDNGTSVRRLSIQN